MRTEKSGWTAALLILQIAVGAMLAVGGIWALQGGGDFAARAIKGLVSGNVENILVIVFGVIELLVGVFMILKIVIGDRFGRFGTVLCVIGIFFWFVLIFVCVFVVCWGFVLWLLLQLLFGLLPLFFLIFLEQAEFLTAAQKISLNGFILLPSILLFLARF